MHCKSLYLLKLGTIFHLVSVPLVDGKVIVAGAMLPFVVTSGQKKLSVTGELDKYSIVIRRVCPQPTPPMAALTTVAVAISVAVFVLENCRIVPSTHPHRTPCTLTSSFVARAVTDTEYKSHTHPFAIGSNTSVW